MTRVCSWGSSTRIRASSSPDLRPRAVSLRAMAMLDLPAAAPGGFDELVDSAVKVRAGGEEVSVASLAVVLRSAALNDGDIS